MKLSALGAVLTGAMLASCATTPRSEVDVIDQRTTVTVDNQSFADMTIYVSRGQRVRLGNAPGKARTVLTIPASMVTGITTLHFIADPIGSSRTSVSEEIQVSEGDSIGLLIPPP